MEGENKTRSIMLLLLMLCLATGTVIVVTLVMPLLAAQSSNQTYSLAGMFTLLLLVVVAVLTVLRWEYGLALTLASLSLVNRLKTVYFLDFEYVFITAETVFLALLLLGWFFTYATRQRRDRLKYYLAVPIFLFLVAGFLSLSSSLDTRVSLRLFISGVAQPIILFFLIINNIKTVKQVKLVAYALMASAVIASSYGLWQSFLTVSETGDPFDYRIVSVFYSPAIFAETILLSFPLVVVIRIWLKPDNRIVALLLDLVLGGLVISLLLTITRGAGLGFMAASLILLLNKDIRSYSLRWVPVLLVLVILQSGLIAELLQRRPVSVRDLGDPTSSTGERIYAWQTALVMIEDNPVGIGLGMFRRTWYSYQPNSLGLDAAHNLLLDTGVELGIIGLIALMWTIIHSLKINISLFRNSMHTDAGKLALGILACIIGYMVHALGSGAELAHNDLTIPQIPLGSPISTGMLIFWSLVACLFILREAEKTGEEPALAHRMPARYLSPRHSNV